MSVSKGKVRVTPSLPLHGSKVVAATTNDHKTSVSISMFTAFGSLQGCGVTIGGLACRVHHQARSKLRVADDHYYPILSHTLLYYLILSHATVSYALLY